MTDFVFLGPSLRLEQAKKIAAAEYLPPVAMGDVYALVRQGAGAGDCIVIIDGYFEQVPAVWHKEILYALKRGVSILGASSMGALRAAELHPFGMIGVGEIFNRYASHALDGDDEVTVVHAPPESGYRSLSDALVNIRYGLELACERQLITVSMRDELIGGQKERFYAHRRWASVFEECRKRLSAHEAANLERFINEERPDLKATDAHKVLEVLASRSWQAPATEQLSFELNETTFFAGLMETVQRRHASQGQSPLPKPDRVLIDYLRVARPDWSGLWIEALLLAIASSGGNSASATSETRKAVLRELCRNNKISDGADLAAWCARNAITQAGVNALTDASARIDVLSHQFRSSAEQHLVGLLMRRGEYESTVAAVEQQSKALDSLGIVKPTLEHSGLDADELQAWYENYIGQDIVSVREHAASVGFARFGDFLIALVRLYVSSRNPC